MLVPNHGVLQLLVTFCALVAMTFASASEKQSQQTLSQASKNETREQVFDNQANQTTSASGILKSHRRAPRYSNDNTPHVKVFNRPPGTKDFFYNYETRGNTSAHTSGELWNTFLEDDYDDTTDEIDRSDVKVKDILRVKPKAKMISKTDSSRTKTPSETPPSPKQIPSTTKSSNQVAAHPTAKLANQKEGYIVWNSDGNKSRQVLPLESTTSNEDNKPHPVAEKTVLKDGGHWKVIGDGGEEGWQVVDDKGEVEWKIEYDDGEWRVISTGDFPSDAEWIDPEYVWGPTENSVNDEPEYNSWQPADYKSPPSWTSDEVYYAEAANNSWPQNEDNDQKKVDESSQVINPGLKSDSPSSASESTNEKFKFGVRRNIPTKTPDSSSMEERTNAQIPEEEKQDISIEDTPQNDQIIFVGKSWQAPVIKNEQKWVQGYGSKSWEGDSTGWNSKTSGETWVTADKSYDTDPWIPKIPDSKNGEQTTSTEESNVGVQDKSIRAWGTGYGSKTWKGNEWNSNVVWKTGVNSNVPWSAENNTWQFPETKKDKKKPEVWSQPIPSKAVKVGTSTSSPNKKINGIRGKWPIRPVNTIFKSAPSRRTESESWSEDDSIGGVVWNPDESDDDQNLPLPKDKASSWKLGGWKVSPGDYQQQTANPWKNNAPSKGSNLVSINWKAGGINPFDSAAVKWDKSQWPGANPEPTWLFQGCKMTLKCGSNDDITNDNYQSTLPDTSDDDTETTTTTTTTAAPMVNIGKGWPPKQNLGKSWKPPSKTWKPPKWKKPTPAPTTPETTMSPIPMTWKATPKPKINWKKPTAPAKMWKLPPSTMMWIETTPAPPEMTWKPPPPPMKWKKAPKPTKSWKPPPTKSWKPPPTKSWKPPKMPVKTWPPPIATPQPDMWPTTKPDCKDTTDTTQPPSQEPMEDDGDLIEPPQIIIITKLPKSSPPGSNDKKDKDNGKTKPSSGPWVFPPRKYNFKTSKNRKDKNIPKDRVKWQPNYPSGNNHKQPNLYKGWTKSISPTKYPWPNNAMRRWTTKKPASLSIWKSKYSKSNTWRQMFKKWMNGM